MEQAQDNKQLSQQQSLNNGKFALNLYKLIKENNPHQNIFFSPINISLCLAMVYAGAKDKTLQEFQDSLHFLPQEQAHQIYKEVQNTLNSNKNVSLTLANKIWPMIDQNFLPEYLNLLKENYNTEIQPLNFNNSQESSQKINEWVENKTNGLIKNLASPDSFNELTRLVLTSAIHFKGNWANKFRKEATQKATFTTSENTKVETDMMYLEEKLPLYQQSKFKMLKLPYIGNDVSMIAVLPQNGANLDEVEKLLTIENIVKFEKRLFANDKVRVQFPKFKFEFDLSLNTLLSSLGLQEAFTENANFSGMNGKSKDLFISEVKHKAFIEVSEEGTEAAAATMGAMASNSLPQIQEFIVDQPFLFYIKDHVTDNMLFYGRYNRP